MRISTRNARGVTILDLKGKITIGGGDVELRDAVVEALAAGSLNILLNLKRVSALDSSGVGEIVASYRTLANRGGKLKLENLSPKVTDVLMLTELLKVLEIFEDEQEAVESFEESPSGPAALSETAVDPGS